MFFFYFICYNASGWNLILVDTAVTEWRKRARLPIVWRSKIREKRKRFKIGHVYDRRPTENGATWNRRRTRPVIIRRRYSLCTLTRTKSKLSARFSYIVIFVCRGKQVNVSSSRRSSHDRSRLDSGSVWLIITQLVRFNCIALLRQFYISYKLSQYPSLQRLDCLRLSDSLSSCERHRTTRFRTEFYEKPSD